MTRADVAVVHLDPSLESTLTPLPAKLRANG
jgi:hypothetical protein